MSDAASSTLFSASPLKVLLLEDSRFDAELLCETLARSHPRASVVTVSDEESFVDALIEGGWDLILSDYELPGFSGTQALKEARERLLATPFIFVSGVIGEDNAVEMLKRGATDYVSKGRLSRLALVIERALREVAAQDARWSAEARLREADAVFARVVESLRDYAVILMDEHGAIRSWNGAAQQIFGLERSGVIGRSARLLFTPEDREAGVFEQELRDARERGKANDDRWMMRSDGLRLWAEGVLTPLYGDDRELNGYCKIVRDATEQYRDAEALRAAKEQAERANQAKDRFLAVLSHELRTPLTPILTATHLLERLAVVPEQQSNLLPMIRRNVALEARLIDDLLDVTAISSGKVTLKKASVDMHRVIANVVDMLAEQIGEAGVIVTQDLASGDARVEGDEARLQQIVWNVVRNAVKFTPRGGRIALRTELVGQRVEFVCTDSGIGIHPDDIGRIFSAFEQASPEVPRPLGSLGLGLAIARGLAADHGGTLVAQSEGPGRGATFRLNLPSEAANSTDTAQGTQAGSDLSSQGCRLLLVEDNIDAAETLAQLLEFYGYRVTHADTCAKALELARSQDFDAVLTDLGLPDGSGIDVGQALSDRMPVVALSGYGAATDLRRSALAGFAGHLVKPADPQTVHQSLQAALAARKADLGRNALQTDSSVSR
ncbi:MAG: response regulator [Pseudomonadota bacterium]